MHVFSLVVMVAMMFGGQGGGDAKADEARRLAEQHRQQAIKLNDLAANVKTEDDARQIVSLLAKMFENELPPGWPGAAVWDRVAKAEYESATSSANLIPDERVAEVWNEYVKEIGAPVEAQTNAAEIHNLRDAQWASAQVFWNRKINQSVWTAPNIVAMGTDGKIADGSRALEAIRTLYSIEVSYQNLLSARERVAKGEVVSDMMKKRESEPPKEKRVESRLMAVSAANPVRAAEMLYVQQHGFATMNRLVQRLAEELFPN